MLAEHRTHIPLKFKQCPKQYYPNLSEKGMASAAAPAPPELAAALAVVPPTPTTAACFLDAVSGRVLPCVALRETEGAWCQDFVDRISGRVFPCVALKDLASPLPAACGPLQSLVSAPLPAPLQGSIPRFEAAPDPAEEIGDGTPSASAAPPQPRLRSVVCFPDQDHGVPTPEIPSSPSAVSTHGVAHAGAPSTEEVAIAPPSQEQGWKIAGSKRWHREMRRQASLSQGLPQYHRHQRTNPPA
jgi:hypothetical protein